MWIRNLGRRIVWHHFHQSTVNAFGDRGKCWVLTFYRRGAPGEKTKHPNPHPLLSTVDKPLSWLRTSFMNNPLPVVGTLSWCAQCFFNIKVFRSHRKIWFRKKFSIIVQHIACLHDQSKVAFLEARLLSSQSEQSEKFSKSPDWLEKNRPSKKTLLFWSCKQANNRKLSVMWYIHYTIQQNH